LSAPATRRGATAKGGRARAASAPADRRRRYAHEVAISAAGYDALTQRRLVERLGARLAGGADAIWTRAEGASPDAGETPLGGEARVVVVLHQRLWGLGLSTRADLAAIEARIAEEGTDFLHVALLDHAPAPAWCEDAEACSVLETGLDACVERIVALVAERGGKVVAAPADADATFAADAERRDRDCESFLGSHRAIPVLGRELERLADDIARRASALRLGEAAPVEIRRAPGRCIVQIGPVALSLSWLRSHFDTVAGGQLLIVEWEGTVGRGAEVAPERRNGAAPERAVAIREEVLLADATGERDWLWRRQGAALSTYTTRELASQCVDSLITTLRERVG
jgi:hypothetical protein